MGVDVKTINLDAQFYAECKTVQRWKENGLICEFRINHETQSIWVKETPEDDLMFFWDSQHILDHTEHWNNA